MLANGTKLGMKRKGESTFKDLPGLKEIPEMGIEPEKVDNTCLTDEVKQYEKGIGDAGELQYKFKYDNSKADCPYRVLRDIGDETLTFQEKLVDGTITEFDAQVSVKRTGGGVNGVIEFTVTMSLQSGFKYTDPSSAAPANIK